MATTSQQTRILAVGKGIINLQGDESTIEEFINGFQSGHLACVLYWRNLQITDLDIVLLFVRRHNANPSHLFHCGVLIGRLSTLIRGGKTPLFPSTAFHNGYRQGLQDYCKLGSKYLVTLSDISALISTQHGYDSSHHGGYIYGFLEGLTEGIHAVKPIIPGEASR